MKRREEIIDAGIEYTLQNRPMCMGGDSFFEETREMNRNKSFEEGAKWADKTMIERAVEWIQMNAMKYMNSIGGCMYFDVINSTKDFKKAMEE